MAKTQVKHRASGTQTRKCKKSLQLTAHIGKARQEEEELKQTSNPTKAVNVPSTLRDNDHEDHEQIILDGRAGNDNLYRGSATEEEEVETRKTSKVVPYQLQQWMFETSSPCITLAERLEKSKWKYEDSGTEEGLCGGECDESWGRMPYDWILFDE